MMTIDPAQRITMQEIQKHSWFNAIPANRSLSHESRRNVPLGAWTAEQIAAVDGDIFHSMYALGFEDINAIRESLASPLPGFEKVFCYVLLGRKHEVLESYDQQPSSSQSPSRSQSQSQPQSQQQHHHQPESSTTNSGTQSPRQRQPTNRLSVYSAADSPVAGSSDAARDKATLTGAAAALQTTTTADDHRKPLPALPTGSNDPRRSTVAAAPSRHSPLAAGGAPAVGAQSSTGTPVMLRANPSPAAPPPAKVVAAASLASASAMPPTSVVAPTPTPPIKALATATATAAAAATATATVQKPSMDELVSMMANVAMEMDAMEALALPTAATPVVKQSASPQQVESAATATATSAPPRPLQDGASKTNGGELTSTISSAVNAVPGTVASAAIPSNSNNNNNSNRNVDPNDSTNPPTSENPLKAVSLADFGGESLASLNNDKATTTTTTTSSSITTTSKNTASPSIATAAAAAAIPAYAPIPAPVFVTPVSGGGDNGGGENTEGGGATNADSPKRSWFGNLLNFKPEVSLIEKEECSRFNCAIDDPCLLLLPLLPTTTTCCHFLY